LLKITHYRNFRGSENMPESRKKGEVVPPTSFCELSNFLTPHPSLVQILIETSSKGATLEKALAVLRASGIRRVDHEILRKGEPSWIRLQFPSDDFQGAILSLTEAGFVKLKGIYPAAKRHIKRSDPQ